MRFDKAMSLRVVSSAVLAAGLVFLTACGGGSSSGGGSLTGVSVGLSASKTSVGTGQTSTITAFVSDNKGVTWSLSPAGVGALSAQTSTSVMYTPPASVTSASVVTITATSTSHTSVAAPIQIGVLPSLTVGLSPNGPQTINQGHPLSVTATLTGDTTNQGVTWSLSSGVGSLTGVTATSVTYNSPGSVTSNTPVTLTATSKANPSSTASVELTVFSSGAGPNVAALTTANGTTSPSTNSFFTSVTICAPATTNCQTIDNILVDTGSIGLRVLQSAMGTLVLPPAQDTAGNILNNCVQFLDGSYLWGPVNFADIKIGSEATSQTSIQVISSGNPTVPTACSAGGTQNDNTAALLGANGVLGVGLEPTDCILAGTDFCSGITGSVAPVYFGCPGSGCSTTDGPATILATGQVSNPIVGFGADSNGAAIAMAALTGSATEVDGSMIFGIGTSSNNAIPVSATALALDANDNFTTVFGTQTLTASFIDSGSNGLFFPSTITKCTANTGFYCPATIQSLSAKNMDSLGDTSTVSFSIDNGDNLLSSTTDSAFSTLGGPLGTVNTCSGGNGSCQFDWGAPFFYGRTVFNAIDGAPTPIGTGPFVAY